MATVIRSIIQTRVEAVGRGRAGEDGEESMVGEAPSTSLLPAVGLARVLLALGGPSIPETFTPVPVRRMDTLA